MCERALLLVFAMRGASEDRCKNVAPMGEPAPTRLKGSPCRSPPMRAALVLVAVLLLAGCVQPDPEAQSVTVANATPSDGLALEALPAGAPPATQAPASLDAPPQWRGGEWWTIKVTDAFDGKSWEATRVVAGKEGDAYLVGMPRDAFSNEQMVIHLPGYGQVSSSSLGFDVHNCPFEPLRFPLADGKEWDTKFECRDFHAQATVQ